MSGFAIEVTQSGDLTTVIDRVTEALKAEGFGILTRIDVHDVLKTKIDVDFRPYTILGACNPVLAHQALGARADIGLMLPCNVTVEQSDNNECLVRFIDPLAMMTFGDLGENETLRRVGGEAAVKIKAAAASLG
ncbi:MAG: DUF302 domain-containing protein [Rhodobacteraceae bacterium]|nr:DUF302 domain-containing protein [Paracoccaceae bacterium]